MSKELSRKLASFEGAHLSGFFVTKPAMVTAMSLLFERVYLPNQLELVIEVSKKYKIRTKRLNPIKSLQFERVDDNSLTIENPFKRTNGFSTKNRT